MAQLSFRDRNKITVGLVSLAVLTALVVGTFLAGQLGWLKPGYEMTGVFRDTGGLRAGMEVRVAGVRAGEIKSVQPDFRQAHVVVTWRVDNGIRLGRNTRAEIRMANLLGGRYLRLAGPVTAPYLHDLSEGERRIPLERTETPMLVGDAVKAATETVRGLDREALSKVIDQLSGITEGDRGRLKRTMQNLAALADTVSDAQPQISKLLDNGDRVLDLVQAKDRQLSQLVNAAQVMLAELRARRTELATFLGSGSATLGELSQLIEQHEDELVKVITDLNATMHEIDPATERLNEVLAWAGPTLVGLGSVAGNGPWLDATPSQVGWLTPEQLALLPDWAAQSGGAR